MMRQLKKKSSMTIFEQKDVLCEVLTQWIETRDLIYFISALPKSKPHVMHSVMKIAPIKQPFSSNNDKWRLYSSEVMRWLASNQYFYTTGLYHFSADLWNKLYDAYAESVLQYRPILQHLTALTIGHFNISGMEFDVSELVICKHLQSLELVCLNLYASEHDNESELYDIHTQICPKLHSLTMKHCKVTSSEVFCAFNTCKHIKSLQVAHCNFADIHDNNGLDSNCKYEFFYKVNHFESYNESDCKLFLNETSLQTLSVNNYSNAQALNSLLTRSSALQNLSLIKSPLCATYPGQQVSQFLPKLNSLFLQAMDVTEDLLLCFEPCQYLMSLQYMYCNSYVSYANINGNRKAAYRTLFDRLESFQCTADLQTVLPSHFPESLNRLKNLQIGESLWGGRGDEVSDSIVYFLSKCHYLQHLSISSCPLQIGKIMQVVKDRCVHMEDILLHSCTRRIERPHNNASHSSTTIGSPNGNSSRLKKLWINISQFADEDMQYLLSKVGPSIETLQLSRCARLSPSVYSKVVKKLLPGLKDLVVDYLQDGKSFSPEHAQAIEVALKGLKRLEINKIELKQSN